MEDKEGGSGFKFLEIGLYLFFHKLDFSFSLLAAPFQTMLYIGLKDYQYFDPVDPLSSTLPKLCRGATRVVSLCSSLGRVSFAPPLSRACIRNNLTRFSRI